MASDRLVGGRSKPQQLEACMSNLQGKDVLVSLLIHQLLPIAATEILHSCFLLAGDTHVPLKEGELKRFDPCLQLLASPRSSQSYASSSLLQRISLLRFRSTYNWCIHSVSPVQDLQTSRVVDGSCIPTTSLPIESSLLPKSVNLYEIPAAVHVLKYILALPVLWRASFKHKSQDASAETIGKLQ